MRVLLIEDEPTTAKSIELMLGSEGFNVYTTDLGEGLRHHPSRPQPAGHARL
jgi:DNA-binding response OmpR family regulator